MVAGIVSNFDRESEFNSPALNALVREGFFREKGGSEKMDLPKMLAELYSQRDKLARLIVAAEDYARGAGKKRGRPPKWMANVKRRGRPPGSLNKKPAASKAAQGD